MYTAVDYFDKALWHGDNILKINPLSPNHYFTKANIYYLKEDYTKALECIETSLSINPDFTHPFALKQLCLILTKDYERLNDFLDNTPLAERPEECRVLYQLVNPEDEIDIDISRVSSMIKEDSGGAFFTGNCFCWSIWRKIRSASFSYKHVSSNLKCNSFTLITKATFDHFHFTKLTILCYLYDL